MAARQAGDGYGAGLCYAGYAAKHVVENGAHSYAYGGLILPDTLRTIGANAFANAMALTLVDIPDNVRCSPLPPAPPPPIQSLDGRARGKGERGEIREVLRRIRSIFQTINNLEAPLTMIFS